MEIEASLRDDGQMGVAVITMTFTDTDPAPGCELGEGGWKEDPATGCWFVRVKGAQARHLSDWMIGAGHRACITVDGGRITHIRPA